MASGLANERDFLVDSCNEEQFIPSNIVISCINKESAMFFDDFVVERYIKEPYDPTKIVMYTKDKVYDKDEEFSLEEIRARRYIVNKQDDKLNLEGDNCKPSPMPSIMGGGPADYKWPQSSRIPRPINKIEPREPVPMKVKRKTKKSSLISSKIRPSNKI